MKLQISKDPVLQKISPLEMQHVCSAAGIVAPKKGYLDKRMCIVSSSAEEKKKKRLVFPHRQDFQNEAEIIQKEFIVRGLIPERCIKINYLIFSIP